MTTFTLQNQSNASSYSLQNKNSSSFTLQNRDQGRTPLLKEDGDYLTTESGDLIILDQSVQGDVWNLQNKS